MNQQPSNRQNNNQNNQQKKGPITKMGRVHYSQTEVIPEGEPVMMGMFSIAKHLASILFDSSASHIHQ